MNRSARGGRDGQIPGLKFTQEQITFCNPFIVSLLEQYYRRDSIPICFRLLLHNGNRGRHRRRDKIIKKLPTNERTDEKARRRGVRREVARGRMALSRLPPRSLARSAISDGRTDGRSGSTEGVTNFVNLISAAVAADNNLKLAAAAMLTSSARRDAATWQVLMTRFR